MMPLLLGFAFLIAALACAFALQNAVPITVSFLTWKIHGSLALVLLFTLAMGALIAACAFLATWIKLRIEITALRHKLSALENRPNELPGGK